MADNRPSVYREHTEYGTRTVYRASSVGGCVRALVAPFLDYEERRPKDRQELMDRSAEEGNLHEQAVRQALIRDGVTVVSTQGVVELEIIPGVVIRGHTDGVIEEMGELRLLEVKSMSTKQFARWQNQGFNAFRRYAWQISVYMHGQKPPLPATYVVKRREDGFTVTKEILTPPVSLAAIRKKILVAERWRRRGELPPCDIEGPEKFMCPFWYLHDEEEEEPDELTEDMEYALGELVAEYLRLRQIEEDGKAAEVARKKLNPEICNLVEGKKVEIQVGEERYRVTQSRGGGRALDRDALRERLGYEYEDYERPYSFTYPSIKRVTEKGD